MLNPLEYEYICWFEALNFMSFLRLLSLRHKFRFRKVIFLRSSNAISLPIRLFKLGRFFDFIPISDIVSTCNEESAVFHKSYSEKSLLAIDIAKNSGVENYLLDFIGNQYNTSKIVFFFRQEIAREIEDIVKIITFIKWLGKNRKDSDRKKHIIVVKKSPWVVYVKSLSKVPLERIFAYPSMRRTIKPFFVPIKIILEIVFNSFLVMIGNKATSEYGRKPKIAVLHAQGADLSKRADYFWFKNSQIDPKRIIVYFKYGCWKPKEDVLKYIDSCGIYWVNLLPWRFGFQIDRLPTPTYIKKSMRAFFTLVKLLFRSLSKRALIKLWQWQALADLINRVTFYEAFFKDYNIKIHFGLYETGIDMIASNMAIELSGGVDLCHHWSNCYVSEILDGKPHDVYFIWGPYYKNIFKRDLYRVENFVCSGYPYDMNFSASTEKGEDYRKKLLSYGARFIVSLFDETHPKEWRRTDREVERLYALLLEKVNNDNSFGLITKPKKKKEFWKRWPGLSELAKKAESTGRCLFLEGSVFPNDAAQAADLTIGFGVYNTPALEAALSGKPAITYDPQNISGHHFYRAGFNIFVFNDPDNIMKKIDEFRNNGCNTVKLGDYSAVLNEIDPFRDGRASERIGAFINQLLESFNNGQGSQMALDEAIRKYSSMWGSDKVESTGHKTGELNLRLQEECQKCCR